jgi:hypothetical protein
MYFTKSFQIYELLIDKLAKYLVFQTKFPSLPFNFLFLPLY